MNKIEEFFEVTRMQRDEFYSQFSKVPEPAKEVVQIVKEVPIIVERLVEIKKKRERRKYDSNLPKLYISYLRRSNKKGICFDLTVEQFEGITDLSCVYCGTQPSKGIDRIDSKDCYHIDNCAPCCTKCNMMKYTYSTSEFIKQCRQIVKYWDNK